MAHLLDILLLLVALLLPIPLVWRLRRIGVWLGAAVIWGAGIIAGQVLSALDPQREAGLLDGVWLIFGWLPSLLYCIVLDLAIRLIAHVAQSREAQQWRPGLVEGAINVEPILDYETPSPQDRPTLSSATSAFAKGLATGTFLAWVVIVVVFSGLDDGDAPMLGCASAVLAAAIHAGIGSAVFIIILALRAWQTSGRPPIPGHRPACLAGIGCAALAVAGASATPTDAQLMALVIGLAVLSAIAATVLPPKRT